MAPTYSCCLVLAWMTTSISWPCITIPDMRLNDTNASLSVMTGYRNSEINYALKLSRVWKYNPTETANRTPSNENTLRCLHKIPQHLLELTFFTQKTRLEERNRHTPTQKHKSPCSPPIKKNLRALVYFTTTPPLHTGPWQAPATLLRCRHLACCWRGGGRVSFSTEKEGKDTKERQRAQMQNTKKEKGQRGEAGFYPAFAQLSWCPDQVNLFRQRVR